MALYNATLKPLADGKAMRNYNHGDKLFLADNYRLAPKQSFLYYVKINVNTATGGFLSNLIGDDISSQDLTERLEAGMLVKRCDLPKFTIDTKTLNAYNRKNINQNKISYDPVSLTFHDDMADVVTTFWNDYYTYYYRDSDYSINDALSSFRNDYSVASTERYKNRSRQGWGYTIRNSGKTPFLESIDIFSLHKKRFSEYTLVNPMITSFRHGQHSAGANEPMANEMTISYEFVLYASGNVSKNTVNGFADIHYDTSPSPLSVGGG